MRVGAEFSRSVGADSGPIDQGFEKPAECSEDEEFFNPLNLSADYVRQIGLTGALCIPRDVLENHIQRHRDPDDIPTDPHAERSHVISRIKTKPRNEVPKNRCAQDLSKDPPGNRIRTDVRQQDADKGSDG